MKSRILFLDIDGVLNNVETRTRVPGTPFIGVDTKLVALLNDLLKRAQEDATKDGAEVFVVLSSAWRVMYGVDQTEKYIRTMGYDGPKFSARTPYGSDNGPDRGHEISDWLADYSKKLDIESFVILDDSTDMAHLMPRLVNTDFVEGLTPAKVEEALEMFRKTYKPE